MAARTVVALDGMGGDNAPADRSAAPWRSPPRGTRSCSSGMSPSSGRSSRARGRAATRASSSSTRATSSPGRGRRPGRALQAGVVRGHRLPPGGRGPRRRGRLGREHRRHAGGRHPLHAPRAGGHPARPSRSCCPAPAAAPVVLLDAGASAEARAEHLPQLALMGRLFARDVLGVARPRVGLLSIGEEEGKGSEVVRRPTPCCSARPGFVGNVEGRDIPGGTLDVVVTDGFTGNVVLKTMEGVAAFLMGEVRLPSGAACSGGSAACWCGPRCGACAIASIPEAYGGAVLLGVRGLAVIGHGNSTGGGSRTPCGWRAGARASAWSSSSARPSPERAPNAPRQRRIAVSSRAVGRPRPRVGCPARAPGRRRGEIGKGTFWTERRLLRRSAPSWWSSSGSIRRR